MNILAIIDGQSKPYVDSMNNNSDASVSQMGSSGIIDNEHRLSVQDITLPAPSARSFACPFEDCSKVGFV